MRMHSLAILPYSAALSCTATYCANREVVVLLQFHIDVTLIQYKFASLVKLFVERFVMVINVYLR